jgi:hypothetical protein
MSRITFVTLLVLMMAWTVWSAAEDEEKTFDLKHQAGLELTEEEEAAAKAEIILPQDKIEISFTLGYLDLNQILFSHEKIIYKYTNEYTYFGDIEFQGQQAFNPQLRLDYNPATWISIEPHFGITVSEYQATIANAEQLSNATESVGDEEILPEPVEEIGEFDAENRSCISVTTGLNMLLYPHNYGNFGRGHWHPYVIGGISRTWLNLNSDYIDDTAAMWMYSGGAGLRFVADDLLSVRFEIMYNRFTLDFDPSVSFTELDEGTTNIPVYEYNDTRGEFMKVDDFENTTLNSISWALGFTANF